MHTWYVYVSMYNPSETKYTPKGKLKFHIFMYKEYRSQDKTEGATDFCSLPSSVNRVPDTYMILITQDFTDCISRITYGICNYYYTLMLKLDFTQHWEDTFSSLFISEVVQPQMVFFLPSRKITTSRLYVSSKILNSTLKLWFSVTSVIYFCFSGITDSIENKHKADCGKFCLHVNRKSWRLCLVLGHGTDLSLGSISKRAK